MKIYKLFFKRPFDIVFSFLVLSAVFPLIIIISILIKIHSPGSILYRGERVGQNGNIFKIYKFRTMYVDADESFGTTSKNDKRVTNIGRFLRKFKLDEIPNFYNVLLGEMSVVGPRPELKRYTDRYSDIEKIILTAKPGITDLSSIQFYNLNYLITDENPDKFFEENFLEKKNKLRLQYVKEISFFLDLKIIIMTIFVILFR